MINKVFYSVVGFKNVKKLATFSKDGYIRKGNAQRVAKDLIAKGYELVMIRLENIWLRNENNEFSSSTPIEKYTQHGIEILKA